jgi:hypothetical protein
LALGNKKFIIRYKEESSEEKSLKTRAFDLLGRIVCTLSQVRFGENPRGKLIVRPGAHNKLTARFSN